MLIFALDVKITYFDMNSMNNFRHNKHLHMITSWHLDLSITICVIHNAFNNLWKQPVFTFIVNLGFMNTFHQS